MTLKRTAHRREARKRARDRKNRAVTPGQLEKVSSIMKDIYEAHIMKELQPNIAFWLGVK